MTNNIKHWEELPEAVIEGNEQYSAVVEGWVNTFNRAEVVIFQTEETTLGKETSKAWAIAHPWEKEGNMMFRDSREEAVEAAAEWMREHPRPNRTY